MGKRLVCGVGVNDANYVVQVKEEISLTNGKRRQKLVWICPYYNRWKHMLQRCYSAQCQNKNPTYKGCSVCDEWLLFSNFKAWMETQDWEGKQLDKDVLSTGNRIYSPNTCVFVSQEVNSFLIDCTKARGDYPLGVVWNKQVQKYQVYISVGGKAKYLGLFICPEEAHLVWKMAKYQQAVVLAGKQDDPRVAKALIGRYLIYDSM